MTDTGWKRDGVTEERVVGPIRLLVRGKDWQVDGSLFLTREQPPPVAGETWLCGTEASNRAAKQAVVREARKWLNGASTALRRLP